MVTVIDEERNLATRDVQRSFIGGRALNVTIDNNCFTDTNTFAIRAKNYNDVLFQIINLGGSNPVDFELYSTLIDSEDPPLFSFRDWTLLENGIGTIQAETNETFRSDIPCQWIIVRLKRGVLDQSTTVNIWVNGNTD